MYKKKSKKNNKTKTLALTLLLFFILSVEFNTNRLEVRSGINNLELSAIYAPILIDDLLTTNTTNSGNWTWASSQPWCTGFGTSNDPFVIENLIIDGGGTDYCITIQNSIANFTIQNCTVYNAGSVLSGILLDNVTYGNLINNNCTNNDFGISILESSYINIVGNIIYGTNWASGIYLYLSNNTMIDGNFIESNWQGIYIEDSDFNTISGNTASRGIWNGIAVVLSSDSNTLSGNTVFNNTYCGIFLSFGDYNVITGNTAYNNTWMGINCNEADFNIFSGNTLYNNSYAGINLYESSFNNITGNTAFNNEFSGIEIEQSFFNNLIGNIIDNSGWSGIYCLDSDFNVIEQSSIDNSGFHGIEIENGHFNNLTGNTIDNSGGYGINLTDSNYNKIDQNLVSNSYMNGIHLIDCAYNSLLDNFVSDNMGNGIELEGSSDNFLLGNTIFDNNLSGILLGESISAWSDDCNITLNIIYNNAEDGITIEDWTWYATIGDNEIYENGMNGINLVYSWYDTCYGNVIRDNADKGIYVSASSIDNLFYENLFLRNGKHAVDDGTGNDWNNTLIGNFWDNWTGPDESPNDGIVDQPYSVSGYGGGEDFLPIAEDGPPLIAINLPSNGDLFDNIAPSFIVRIVDDYLVEMWYTIDGGLNNYTFTANGTIDQSAWDGMSDGTITLQFYANDLPGNIGIAEITIEKDTQAPIITINTPNPGEIFGNDAPSFNVTVTDPNLDSVWLELDGLNIELSIPIIGTINQTFWAALPEGNYTITLHANDTLGHSTSEDVLITKSVPSEAIGLDYFITSFLILITGGMGVIVVIVKICTKKRLKFS